MRVLTAIRYKNGDRELMPMEPHIGEESRIKTAQDVVRSVKSDGFVTPGGKQIPGDRIQSVIAMVQRDPKAA